MRQQTARLRGEEEYFHQLDVELCDKIFRLAESREERQRLEEAINLRDPALLDALARLGFRQSTAMLLFVAPLVEVAWAAGPPSRAVRRHILALAGRRGVKSDSPACRQLSAWLDQRPGDEFFDGTLGVLAGILSALPAAERSAWRDDLLSSCRETAAVHCRVFGWSHYICAAKRRVIADIGRRLESEPQAPA